MRRRPRPGIVSDRTCPGGDVHGRLAAEVSALHHADPSNAPPVSWVAGIPVAPKPPQRTEAVPHDSRGNFRSAYKHVAPKTGASLPLPPAFRSRLSQTQYHRSGPWLPPSANDGRSGRHASVPASTSSSFLPRRCSLAVPQLFSSPALLFDSPCRAYFSGSGSGQRKRVMHMGRNRVIWQDLCGNQAEEGIYVRADLREDGHTIKRKSIGI
jgi:hypothetical protein